MNRSLPARGGIEPLAQALGRARAALEGQPLPVELDARLKDRWAGIVPGPEAAAALAHGLRRPEASPLAPLPAPASPRPFAGGAPAGAVGLWPTWQRWLAGSGATLCGVALALSLLLMLTAPPRPEPMAGLRAPSTGFIPLVSAQRLDELTRTEAAAAWLVPGEWPRERLVSLGLPFDPARAGESVRAELLVHASGDVLAVRVLAQ